MKVGIGLSHGKYDRGHLDNTEALVMAISAEPDDFVGMFKERPAVVEGGKRDIGEGMNLVVF